MWIYHFRSVGIFTLCNRGSKGLHLKSLYCTIDKVQKFTKNIHPNFETDYVTPTHKTQLFFFFFLSNLLFADDDWSFKPHNSVITEP